MRICENFNGLKVAVVESAPVVLSLNIRTLSGKSVKIELKSSQRIRDLKQLLYEKEGIPTEQQRLVYKGNVLGDDKCLLEYNIGNNSLIHLVLALRG
uniref:Ubiquitin-like domain-containing protein n=1 Tax=Arcella intermedia TaxID=1963864 RepID=A0A6B2LTB3_9EUKA